MRTDPRAAILTGMLEQFVTVRAWSDRALCAGRGDEWVFFAGSHINAATKRAIAEAVATCHRCPVELDCRFDALLAEKSMPGAVAGGLTPPELAQLRREPEYIAARRFLHRPTCGTTAAYTLHLEFGEDCEICREARSRIANPEQKPRGCPGS